MGKEGTICMTRLNEYVDQGATNVWVDHEDIFLEVEGFIIAIQDQIISTKNYLKLSDKI